MRNALATQRLRTTGVLPLATPFADEWKLLLNGLSPSAFASVSETPPGKTSSQKARRHLE
jgi:hypothetical protein